MPSVCATGAQAPDRTSRKPRTCRATLRRFANATDSWVGSCFAEASLPGRQSRQHQRLETWGGVPLEGELASCRSWVTASGRLRPARDGPKPTLSRP